MYDIEYFRDRLKEDGWGKVYEDDKYFSDADIMDSFPCFVHYAFAWLGLPALSTIQLEITSFVENRDGSNPHRLVFSPRGIGKSILSQCYVVWSLLNNPDHHILVVSAGAQRAGNYTQFVKKLIGLLPATRIMYPRNNIERTATASFDVAGSSASDSPSVYAVGVQNQITGFRATKIVFDDIETPITASSLPLTEKVISAVNEAFNLMMSGYNDVVFLATPHSENSIYLNFLDKGTKGFICPARYPEDQSAYMNSLPDFVKKAIDNDETIIGQPIDERFTDEFLRDKELRIGKSNFKLQYQADVTALDSLRHPLKLSDLIVDDIDDDIAPLKVSYSSMPDNMLYIKHHGFKNDRFYKPFYCSPDKDKYSIKIMSVDPSGSGSDEMGITVIYFLNGRFFIKKCFGIQGGYSEENLTLIATMCNDLDLNSVVIEKNFGDGMFAKVLEPYMFQYAKTTSIEELSVKGQKEVRIINNIEPLLNQHKIVVDKAILDSDYNKKAVNSFTFQLSHLTRERECIKHDDIIDSLSNGVEYLKEYMVVNENKAFEKSIERIAEENRRATEEVFRPFFYNSSSNELVF